MLTHRKLIGHRQPDREGARTVGHTGALSTGRRHRQPVRQGPTGGTVHCTHRGHWQPLGRGEVGHRQPDRQGAYTVGHIRALSTVHTEDTDNQSDRHPLDRHVQRALATSRREGRLGTEGTEN